MWKKIMYALGQLGWSLASYGVANLLVYFYSPPTREGSDARIFPVFIAAAAIIGVAGGVSRLFDAVTDPLIAGWSDRSTSGFGRRRKFLLIGAIPFALLSFLVFMPPVQGPSGLNTAWLFITNILFYFFMTMYVTPFFALLSELGHSPDERLQLSTMISITWALGFMIGSQVYGIKEALTGILAAGGPLTPELGVTALQLTLMIFGGISLVLMLLPVIFIRESVYCERHVSNEGSFEALVSAFRNRNFRFFAVSDLSYWLAVTFVQTGISFYVIMLLKLPESVASTMLLVMFLCSFLFYVPIGIIAKKTGKKRLLSIAFVVYILATLLIATWGFFPIDSTLQGFIVMIIIAFPMAVFGILPNAIVADIADADGIETGNFKAAVFFGARTFMSKLGQSLTLFLFPLVSTIGIGAAAAVRSTVGDSPATVGGVRLTAIVAAIGLAIGLVLFLVYNEKQILATIASRGKAAGDRAAGGGATGGAAGYRAAGDGTAGADLSVE
jgi:Na+/melibiose symporter-like transporter